MPFGLRNIKISISARLAGLFSVTFAVGLFFAFLFAYLQISYSLEKSSKEVIQSKLRETATILANNGIDKVAQNLNADKNSSFLIRILNSQGDKIYSQHSAQEKNFDFNSLFKEDTNVSKRIGWRALPAIDDEDKFEILTEKVGENYFLQVGKSSEDREDILERIVFGFCVVGSIFIILGGGLGVWYAKSALIPIRNLVNTFQTIKKGDLSGRVSVGKSYDELTELGETFNRMMARIEKLVRVMKESLDNVAHDIRTPLTRIRAVAELALLSGDRAVIQEALEESSEAAAEISALVDQLMSISEAEAGTLKLNYELCHVRKVLSEVVDVYEFVAQEKEIRIDISEGDFIWNFDRKRVKQAIGNLLDNAIKFSAAGSSIQISVTKEADQLKIWVKDQGVGIADSDLDRIWDRLFRGDKSRSTQGLGLGLSIVKSIAIAHRGRVEAHPGIQGMIFVMILPQS